jgi:CubicO group peptidase (beta-lactamase class C family)
MRCIFLGWFMVGCLSGHCQSQREFQKIDSLFSIGGQTKKPGGVVAVLKGDEVIYKRAVGLADIACGIPNSFDHKYDLASVAKQFTGICVALLEEQGKLSTEDLLSKYYPEFQLPKEIKLKNLLDHTSGIREAYVLAMLSGKINLKGELRKKYNTKSYLLEVLKREKDLNFPVGSELAYTNINYILLADIVEKLSKRPFHLFADSAIFKPLQMHHTFYRYEQDMEIPGEAKGYLVKGKKYKPMKATGGILGDGKLVTTIGDIVKWESNLRHNKLGKANQQLIDKLYTSSKLNNGELTHYGYGFWINEYRGLKQINHGGDDGRFTSFILKFPEKDMAIIVLSNSSLYNNTVSSAYQIADILLRESFPQPKVLATSYKFVTLSNAQMQPLVGIYKHINEKGLAQLRKITLDKDSLYVNSGFGARGLNLKAVTSDLLVAKNRMGHQIKFTFINDSTGFYLEEQFQDNKPLRFEIIENEKVNLSNFKGWYYNETTRVRLKIKHKNDKLIAKKSIIKIPMVEFGLNQFYAYNNDALFIFQPNEKGQITSLKINASDFRNFIFKKIK